MKNKIYTLFIFCGFFTTSLAQEESTFVDDRDGRTYKSVTIKIELEGGVFVKRTWMAENLNYELPGSFCYKNEPAYCEIYGRLYTFEAAIKACPEGWHLPTIGEWMLLFETYGGIHKAGLALQKGGESNLNLLLGGFGDPGSVFKNIAISGNYWDAEKKSSSTSGLISLQHDSQEIFHSTIGHWHRNSCRCVKDH